MICSEQTYKGQGKECPICAEKRRRMKEENLEWDAKELAELGYKKRVAYAVCFSDEKGDDVYGVLDYQFGWFHKPLDEKCKKHQVYLLDETDTGMSVNALPTAHTFKNNKGEEVTIPGKVVVTFSKRDMGFEEEDLALLPNICNFFDIKSSEEIYKLFHGISVEDNTSSEEPVKEEAPTMTVTETDVATGESTTTEAVAAPVAGSSSRRGVELLLPLVNPYPTTRK